MLKPSRRELLTGGAAGAAVLAAKPAPAASAKPPKAAAKKDRWILGMNTSTIRPASLEEKIKVTAAAGFDTLELWINDIDGYEKGGKSAGDLKKRIEDAGLWVPNVIGIWNSMPPTDEAKDKAMDEMKRKMSQAAKAGAKHIAAIPTPDRADIDLLWAAKRYQELIDVGKKIGIRVAIEFIGFIKGVHTLGQAAAIAIEADRAEARIVADTFHVYRGGSSFKAVCHLDGDLFAVWHYNDAPKEPERFKQRDGDRVYPGDGVLPLPKLLRDLWAQGFRGPLSLELFMRSEWKRPAAEVAKIGMEKMRKTIQASGVGA